MKLEVNITKTRAFAIVGAILIFAGIFGVYAVWDTAKIVYHNAADVKVTIDGVSKSLQESITDGSIGGASTGGQIALLYNDTDWVTVADIKWNPAMHASGDNWNSSMVALDLNRPVLAVSITEFRYSFGGVCSASINPYFAAYVGYPLNIQAINFTDAYTGTIGGTDYGWDVHNSNLIQIFGGDYNMSRVYTCNTARCGKLVPGNLNYIPAGKNLYWKVGFNGYKGGNYVNCKIKVLYGDYVSS